MKTTKPISILLLGMSEPTPGLAQLASEGHSVSIENDALTTLLQGYDIILGPRCWRYLPDISDKFIDRIVKEARAAQPPKPKKTKPVKKGHA